MYILFQKQHVLDTNSAQMILSKVKSIVYHMSFDIN